MYSVGLEALGDCCYHPQPLILRQLWVEKPYVTGA